MFDDDAVQAAELTGGVALLAPHGERPVGVEHLDAVIADLTVCRIDGDAGRRLELALLAAGAAPAADALAVFVEHLDAVILQVGDVEPTFGIELRRFWVVELARLVALAA